MDIQNVPGGSPQTDGWSCAPNSASRVLRWYGINRRYEQLRAEREEGDLISDLHLGTRPTNLLDLMRKYRPQTRIATGLNISGDQTQGLNQLFAQVEKGKPVIVLNHLTEQSYTNLAIGGCVPRTLHRFVVTGFDRGARPVTFRDTNGAERSYTFDKFRAMWNWQSGGAAGGFLTGTLNTKPRTMIYRTKESGRRSPTDARTEGDAGPDPCYRVTVSRCPQYLVSPTAVGVRNAQQNRI